MLSSEFTNIKFGNYWSKQLGLTVVSNGDRQTQNLFYDFSNATLNVPGRKDTMYFGVNGRGRNITINFAFDNLKQEQLEQIKQWLAPQNIKDLILDFMPYCKFVAKVNSNPTINFLPFEEIVELNNKKFKRIIYKGELEIDFLLLSHEGFSDYHNYEEVMTLFDYDSEYIPEWVFSSKLPSAEGQPQYDAKGIKFGNFYLDNLSITDTLLIGNSGTNDSKVNLTFELTEMITTIPLIFNIYKYNFGEETLSTSAHSTYALNRFDDYKPFKDLYVGDDANINRWKIVIDSENLETYIINKFDDTKIVNLGFQTNTNDFLKLLPIEYVDYYKDFSNLDNPKNSPFAHSIFNKIEVSNNIKNVAVTYKHKYL